MKTNTLTPLHFILLNEPCVRKCVDSSEGILKIKGTRLISCTSLTHKPISVSVTNCLSQLVHIK